MQAGLIHRIGHMQYANGGKSSHVCNCMYRQGEIREPHFAIVAHACVVPFCFLPKYTHIVNGYARAKCCPVVSGQSRVC